jgi:hypothetical protein
MSSDSTNAITAQPTNSPFEIGDEPLPLTPERLTEAFSTALQSLRKSGFSDATLRVFWNKAFEVGAFDAFAKGRDMGYVRDLKKGKKGCEKRSGKE